MAATSETAPAPRHVLAAILGGGFMAATFDFFAAMLIYGGPASGVAHAIARGWFGAAVKTMPPIVDVIGIASHYAILLVAAAIFVLASLRFPILRQRAWITGPLFGVCIYLVMHLIVLPLSAVHAMNNPKGLQLVEEVLGHMFVIGLPVALWARALVGRD
ncbi:MAG TPA: hypothetical protein VFE18_11700 [Phenylobacterium sp.]|jgi:hypothetical protein|uniref:hypothetical protein n=1 Tax=Phenylobacterium sp. TaxID=1871053 RepID=UPI002D396969|nr:hypothetical protein [Phenylobacterium sp.]HZZ68825.1 hypothetical protein [Phenylobacterium sp.]